MDIFTFFAWLVVSQVLKGYLCASLYYLLLGGIVACFAWELTEMGRASTIVRDWAGPRRLPLLGNAHQVGDGPELVTNFMRWFRKFGSPTRISLGAFHMVHVHSANDVEQTLKSTTNINKSRDYLFLEEWLGRGLLTANGTHWFQRRKLLTPAFHFAILKDFVPVFNAQTRTLVDLIRKRLQKNLPKQSTSVPSSHPALWTSSAVRLLVKSSCCCGHKVQRCKLVHLRTKKRRSETAMGTTLNSQTGTIESGYEKALRDYGEALMKRLMTPWLWPKLLFRLFDNKRYNAYYNAIETMNGFTNKVIDERITERAEEKKGGKASSEVASDGFGAKKRRVAFLDLLLDLMDQGKLTKQDVREETETFMFEGHDTTSHGMMWALYALGQHPECQRRLREEIAAVVGDQAEILPEQLAEMPYLDMCVKEAHRRWTPVPFVMRRVTEPLKLDDAHTLPVGSTVYINFYRLQLDPEHWAEPEKFIPERFSAENAEGRHPFATAPFSAGVRNCIGQKFATMEEKITLIQLMRAFKAESATPEEEMKPAFGMVLIPTVGVHLKLTPLNQ